MNDIEVAKVLGWFSVALGGLELVAGGALRRNLGLALPPGTVQAFGVREIGSGALVLTQPGKAGPLWIRTAGDALDIVTLAAATLRPGNRRRTATGLALLAVLGVTAVDVMTATALQRRAGRALRVAQAGRIT